MNFKILYDANTIEMEGEIVDIIDLKTAELLAIIDYMVNNPEEVKIQNISHQIDVEQYYEVDENVRVAQIKSNLNMKAQEHLVESMAFKVCIYEIEHRTNISPTEFTSIMSKHNDAYMAILPYLQ